MVDGYIRRLRVYNVPPCIRSMCAAYLTSCFSLIRVSSEYWDDDVKCSAQRISESVRLFGFSFLSLMTVTGDNQLWCRGMNNSNQLGFKDAALSNNEKSNIEPLSPNDFFNEQGLRVHYITTSDDEYSKHMLVQTGDCEIYAFGSNDHGQCGYTLPPKEKSSEEDIDDDETNQELHEPPRLIQRFASAKINILEISKGLHHTLFLSKQGRVFGCGSNERFQLGLKEPHDFPDVVELSNTPAFPSSLVVPVLQIACCSDSSLFVDARRRLYGVGENYYGQLSFNAEEVRTVESVTLLRITSPVQQVQSGSAHVCLMDDTCQVMTFGRNYWGQCGLPLQHNACREVQLEPDVASIFVVDTPTMINSLLKHGQVQSDWQIVCGGENTYIMDSEQNLYTCGTNRSGECLVEGKDKYTEDADGKSLHRIHTPAFVSNEMMLRRYTEGKQIVALAVGIYDGLYILTE